MDSIQNQSEIDLRTKVILSANRAMQGAATQHLRSVTVEYNQECLILKAYFDKGATEHDKELIDAVSTEMMADLWQDIAECRFEAVDLPFPGEMMGLKDWVYLRHENIK